VEEKSTFSSFGALKAVSFLSFVLKWCFFLIVNVRRCDKKKLLTTLFCSSGFNLLHSNFDPNLSKKLGWIRMTVPHLPSYLLSYSHEDVFKAGTWKRDWKEGREKGMKIRKGKEQLRKKTGIRIGEKTGIGIGEQDRNRDWGEGRERKKERKRGIGLGKEDGKREWRLGREREWWEGRELRMERRKGVS
jgi:hypothetical protein